MMEVFFFFFFFFLYKLRIVKPLHSQKAQQNIFFLHKCLKI